MTGNGGSFIFRFGNWDNIGNLSNWDNIGNLSNIYGQGLLEREKIYIYTYCLSISKRGCYWSFINLINENWFLSLTN